MKKKERSRWEKNNQLPRAHTEMRAMVYKIGILQFFQGFWKVLGYIHPQLYETKCFPQPLFMWVQPFASCGGGCCNIFGFQLTKVLGCPEHQTKHYFGLPRILGLWLGYLMMVSTLQGHWGASPFRPTLLMWLIFLQNEQK